MDGVITKTQRAKSGKTLGVEISGKWFTTKNWELENMVGKRVVFDPSVTEYNGSTITWINEYQTPGAAIGPSRSSAAVPPTPPIEAYDEPPAQGIFQRDVDYDAALRFASNITAHAIAANLIQGPEALAGWSETAFHLAVNLQQGIDTEIPF